MDTIKGAIKGNNILQVLRTKPFFLMMLSEVFSQFSFNMLNFALIFIVYTLTRSNTAVSGIILSFTIPAIFLSVISGVFVDRWNKKNVLFYTNFARGFLLLIFLLPSLHLGLIYMLTFAIAIATQFFIPAESAIIPTLVPRKLIISANSIFSIGILGTVVLGYIFSGPILLLFGKTYMFVALSALFFISAFFIVFIKPLYSRKNTQREIPYGIKDNVSFGSEIKELFFFVRTTKKIMRAFLMLTIVQAIIFMFVVLGPGYLSTVLKVEVESLSLILIAPAAIGMGIGAIVLGSIGKRYKLKHLSALGFLVGGIALMLFPFFNRVTASGSMQLINSFLPKIFAINILHMVILLSAIVGASFSLIFIPSNTTIQLETNDAIRGRIFGLLNALIGAVSFLPVILAGGLADLLGVGAVIAGIGILMLILSIIFFILE